MHSTRGAQTMARGPNPAHMVIYVSLRLRMIELLVVGYKFWTQSKFAVLVKFGFNEMV